MNKKQFEDKLKEMLSHWRPDIEFPTKWHDETIIQLLDKGLFLPVRTQGDQESCHSFPTSVARSEHNHVYFNCYGNVPLDQAAQLLWFMLLIVDHCRYENRRRVEGNYLFYVFNALWFKKIGNDIREGKYPPKEIDC